MDGYLTVSSDGSPEDTYLGLIGSCGTDSNGVFLDLLCTSDDIDGNAGNYASECTIEIVSGQEVIINWNDAYSPSSFTFSVTENPAGCEDDVFEENDSHNNPVPITAGSYDLQMCAGDEDWFSITVNNGEKLKITLTDNDVNADITAKDTTGSGVVKIKTGRYTTGLAVTLTETDIDTGIFEQTIQITKPGGGNTTNAKVEAAVGNTVQVIYLDAADASGSAATVIAEAKVTSVDATMAYDKANYDEGDIVTLTVTDSDANLDPATIETISIGVTSTSDPIGLTLNAVETGADTGIFSLKVGTLNGIATGKLFAKTGDTITSTYSDAYPADYATAATPAAKSVTATVKVGATVTMTVPAGAISVKNSAGTVVASPTSGSILLLESTITSAATADTAYTFLVQVKNVQGEVTSLTWTTGTIAASGSLTIAQSWIPTTAGTYTVQVFVWDNLTDATP
jgi:hypothetical protein